MFACTLVHHRPRCECDPAACLGLDWRQHGAEVDFLIAPLPTAGNAAGVEGFAKSLSSRQLREHSRSSSHHCVPANRLAPDHTRSREFQTFSMANRRSPRSSDRVGFPVPGGNDGLGTGLTEATSVCGWSRGGDPQRGRSGQGVVDTAAVHDSARVIHGIKDGRLLHERRRLTFAPAVATAAPSMGHGEMITGRRFVGRTASEPLRGLTRSPDAHR